MVGSTAGWTRSDCLRFSTRRSRNERVDCTGHGVRARGFCGEISRRRRGGGCSTARRGQRRSTNPVGAQWVSRHVVAGAVGRGGNAERTDRLRTRYPVRGRSPRRRRPVRGGRPPVSARGGGGDARGGG